MTTCVFLHPYQSDGNVEVMVEDRVFRDTPDDVLLRLLAAKPASADVLESIIIEADGRGLLFSKDADSLLGSFVKTCIGEFFARYARVDDTLKSGDRKDVTKRFESFVNAWIDETLHPKPTEPDWPWPITDVPAPPAGRSEIAFDKMYSGLWLCGYRTGKTNGMPAKHRQEFLDFFFRNPLPSIVKKYHGDDYGEPGSEKRLQKMANVIAANCRNFKKNDRDKFGVAISEWEADLYYLKRSYYKAGSFPWPPVEPD